MAGSERKRGSPHWTLLVLFLLVPAIAPAQSLTLASPDGGVELHFELDSNDSPVYRVSRGGEPVLGTSKLGLLRDDADFTRGLAIVSVSDVEIVTDDYELLASKRRHNHYRANARTLRLATRSGQPLDIDLRVSDDGIAFRYRFPDTSRELRRILAEASSFRLPDEARAWLQPVAPAKSGWSSTNPSYEELYLRDIDPGAVSPLGRDWVFPALFRVRDTWLLVSETGLDRHYCGSRLASTWRSPEYTIAFPEALEHFQGGPVRPESSLPWTTPWRFVVIGDLETIVESSLGTDLAVAAAPGTESSAAWPGRASWSWPLLKDDETVLETQKEFVDYAARMGWEYTLVDSMWDGQIGWDGIRELVAHARERGVKILLWYNSAGDWNSTPLTPRDRILTRERRREEMQRLADIGIAGLKVDFFAGDGQSVIGYYQDILDDAADFGLTINFHGATLPRGWHRTWPNLMTMESVRGLEFVTFDQKNAEDEPWHAAMLPFTRNVFDPMDYTPLVLDEIPGIERRTSSAFQLALTVLFTSGIQHYAEIPEGMAKAPEYVREFLRGLPRTWEEVEYLEGFPGDYVVLARRAADRWYVAGINGGREPRLVEIDIAQFDARRGDLVTDGDDALGFERRSVTGPGTVIEMRPGGGFVLQLAYAP